ncbi:MAG: hypothetical protein K6D96_03350 [Acetatifactor sp.]|nr:hypothetical protein [Acetatifactor sp.]
MINGIIFQRKQNIAYKGVEGENWYLNDRYPEIFEKFFEDNIEKSWYDSEYVDVCNDEMFIRKYIELSDVHSIDYRILLCDTEKKHPSVSKIMGLDSEFIGYDYAYAGGSYYSAVYNEICLGSFTEYKLNSNGLFQEYEQIIDFINEREHRINSGENLEKGDFIIYKLFEIQLAIKKGWKLA